MDVTPRELRDVEIREAFRGYNRDEVNDLLERAATAIEALNERARVLGERLTGGQADTTGRGRETEDMLHRTLLLAQRASDEAIAEAEEKARVMLDDAEGRSRRMLADAAVEARRTTDSERRRLDQEIMELQRRSEALSNDVDGLEHFESEYRSRLTSAIEADLHAIERDLKTIRDRSSAMPGDRPAMTVIATDSESARTGTSGETVELDVRGMFDDDKAQSLAGPESGSPASQPISDAAQAAASEMADTGSLEGGAADTTKAPAAAEQATIDLYGAEQGAVESAALDDDSFFASLREAVRDDAPLGPRDASERTFFDQDDSKASPTFREAFKRRR